MVPALLGTRDAATWKHLKINWSDLEPTGGHPRSGQLIRSFYTLTVTNSR
jgi:hypothetical protein